MSDLSEISKNENGEGSMSRNAIKYLAMAAMFCNHFAYIRDPFTDPLHAGIETDEPEHDVQPSSMSGSGVGCRSCKT